MYGAQNDARGMFLLLLSLGNAAASDRLECE